MNCVRKRLDSAPERFSLLAIDHFLLTAAQLRLLQSRQKKSLSPRGTFCWLLRVIGKAMLLANWNIARTFEAVHTADELDLDLFARCRTGDRMALEQFVRCYERRIFAFLSRSLDQSNQVDDLAQEVFLRAYRNIQRFDPNGPARLSTWLLSIAVNVAIDARRRSRTQPSADAKAIELKTSDNPEAQLWRQELNSAMARAAAALPPDQRDTFILAEYHQLSVSEIAQVMGTKPATVKTRLFRAKMHLRNTLAEVWEATR